MNNKQKVEWYDVNRLLSHNANFYFVLSGRGAGKTYGFKKWMINRYIKKGEQFIYIRRYKDDIKQSRLDEFFADIIANNEFPDDELTVKNKEYYINGELAGWAIDL